MFGHKPTAQPCHFSADGDSQSPLLGKNEALSLFIELQRQGFFPYMLEEHEGRFRVGHSNDISPL